MGILEGNNRSVWGIRLYTFLPLYVVLLCLCGTGCSVLNSRLWTGEKREVRGRDNALIAPDLETADLNDRSGNELGDEGGLRRISRILRRGTRALRGKEFTSSDRYLQEARKALAAADSVTRSHPDFEDLEIAVTEAAERYERLLAAHRADTRQREITQLLVKASGIHQRAEKLVAALQVRNVLPSDLEVLDELLHKFDGLSKEGRPYLIDANYAKTASQLNSYISALLKVRHQSDWYIKTTTPVRESLQKGVSIAKGSTAMRDSAAKIERLKLAVVQFERCTNRVKGALSQLQSGQFSDQRTLTIDTNAGTYSLEAIGQLCAGQATKITHQMTEIADKQVVRGLLESIDSAMLALAQSHAEGNPTAQLTQVIKTVRVMQRCRELLSAITVDESYRFATAFGALSLSALFRRCAQEENTLHDSIAGIRWLITIAPLLEIVAEIDSGQKEQKRMVQLFMRGELTAARQRVQWRQEQLLRLERCTQMAKGYASSNVESARYLVPTVWGRMTVATLRKRCAKANGSVQQNLANDEKELEIALFMGGCHKDEVTTVKLKGVPYKINNHPNGRVFVYRKYIRRKQYSYQKIAFDLKGHRSSIARVKKKNP